MARSLLIMGEPGTGKSASLYELNPEETFVIAPNNKDLPFPKSSVNYTRFDPTNNPNGNVYVTESLDDIRNLLHSINTGKPNVKTVVIDDFSHYLTHRLMSRSFIDDTGFSKWNELGAAVYNALFSHIATMRKDLTIVVIHHTEVKDNGTIGEKTAGKLMDGTIMVSSWFTIVLHSRIITEGDVTRYMFLTNREAIYLAKSPPGMFPEKYHRNNLKEILEKVEDYYTGKSTTDVQFI